MTDQPTYDATRNKYRTPEDDAGALLQVRHRFTAAQVNAGASVVAAAAGALRLVGASLTAIGGAAAGADAVVLLGTRAAAPVTLVSVDVGGLTQSALVESGDAAAVLLADGGSHAPLDANTPITIAKTGAALTGATHIDVVLKYAKD